ncbi:TonB-dependent receptor [Edaphobacter sp. HDX4]|uniref:TonB-dependent receptor n=1 Tax=Edaphobacter sp. HDX4 TaxID=2794064 RepID=UPI002FE6906F
MKRYARWLLLIATAVGLTGNANLANAQSMNAGDIRGIVTDPSGAAIPDVTVTVLNKNTGVSKDFTTNQDGLYDTSSIVPGTYEITFSKEGFQKYVRSSITLQVQEIRINAQLTVGAVTEQVVVNTDLPLLSTENAEQTTTLEAKTMAELPQTGTPNWENFTILVPGASGAPGGSQGATNPGQEVAVNGNLPFSTVLADGAAITLPSSANADVMIFETIQEVKVSSSAFSAQYGVGGIMFNQISKGGTSSFHGSAYEYFQNDAMNAASYAFAQKTRQQAIAKVRYNNFGFSVGGPILKKRLFFFFDYDKIINHGAASQGYSTVATDAMLNGDFTGLPTIYDPASTVLTQATGQRPLPGVTGQVQKCPCYDRLSFAQEYGNGNRIPQSRLDPVAKALRDYLPKANTPPTIAANGVQRNNFYYNVPNSQPFQKFFGRADFDITGNNRLTMTETASDNPAYSNGQGNCPINCQSQDVSRHNAQITDVWTITPNVINELRLGYTNQLNFFVPASLGQGYPEKLGWQFAKADVFPTININDFYRVPNDSGITSAINAVYKEHVYDPSDVVTLIRGKHILHFGGEFLFFRDNSTAWGNITPGTMGYTGIYTSSTNVTNGTGLSYADFLLGQTQNWTAQVTPEYGARMRLPQVFVQDDFKVTPNLTLNLGLRYQIQSGWGEVKGNMRVFDPVVPNPGSGTTGAMWYGSTKAHGRSTLQAPVYNTFLPRVGFAWQMHSDTVLRGGFGLYAYNWSLDTYGGGMGSAFGTQGNLSDQAPNVNPVVILGSSGASLPYLNATTAPEGFNGQQVTYNQYHSPVGGSYQWNLSLQKQVGADMVMEMSYVASHGHDLPFPVDINQVHKENLSPSDTSARPFPQYRGIQGSTNNALSNYNSLQAVVQKRMSHGLNFNFSYVWSHFLSEMDSSGWGSRAGAQNYQDAYDPSANYSNSNFDVRNAFKGSVVYQLPFGKGRQFLNNNLFLDEVIGGWQTSGTLVLQSGQPFTVNMSDNSSSYTLTSNGKWYPNLVGSPSLSSRGGSHGTNQWFNEAAYAQPTPGTLGNSGRNSLNGPGLTNVNFSLGKSFPIWENVRFQLRADAQNIFNHPSFGLPNGVLTLNSSGAVTTGTSTIRSTTVGGRTMQLSGRITF